VERHTRITNAPRAARRPRPSVAWRRGFTLAEAMIASVVLAIAVVGISSVLAASYKQSSVRGNTSTALALAQQLMEEIASRPMSVAAGQTDQPGWSTGHTDRTQYDTIGDYNGYTDTSGAVAADGATFDLGNGDAYTRTVSVQSNALPSGFSGTASDFVLVTVTVSMPHSQSLSISQLFTRTNLLRYRKDG